MIKAPLVSICCVSFNHSPFIAKAIEGFLMQETTFSFEIIIGEDCSTDNTTSITRDYAHKFPELIRLITSEKNVGGKQNEYRVFLAARGKYIAICEGDDYWTSPDKLQKQVEFLEKNENIAGCFHDVITVDSEGILISESHYIPLKKLYNQRDALLMRSSYASCSLVFKRDVLDKEQKWYWENPTDFALDLLITEKGLLAYIPDSNMAAYRIHQGGIWQGNSIEKNKEADIERELILLSNEKFRREYGEILTNNLKEHIQCLKPKNISGLKRKIKFIGLYYLNSKSKKLNTFKTVILLLFPQLREFKKRIQV